MIYNTEGFKMRWKKSDFHIRGCMLEGLAGEFERNTVDKETVVEILRWIASQMK